MKAVRNNNHYYVEVPRTQKDAVAVLMAHRGLTFSMSASNGNKAVLFSDNPYSLADLPCDDAMMTKLREGIEASYDLAGKGKYPVPPGKELWPYQVAALDYTVPRGGGLLAQSPGLGKRQPLDERMLTPEGWKENQELVPGDKVFGADGNPVTIEAVFAPARAPVYRVTFSDGRSVRCDLEHLWEVQERVQKKHTSLETKVLTVRQLLEKGLYRGVDQSPKNIRFYVPLVEPINFSPKSFDIHPYVLGVLLGDGYLGTNRPSISCPDIDVDIIGYVTDLIKPYVLRVNRHPDCPQYRLVLPDNKDYQKSFARKIEALGINVKSPKRFIPEEYFKGSVKQRYDLLRGLMDTDGSCQKNRTTFHTLSLKLAEDVAELVRSLGGWSKVRSYDRGVKGIEYQVNVRTRENPFYLERKGRRWRYSPKPLSILSVEAEGEALQRCIKVSDPRGLYVTSGYTLTHNTPTSIAFCNHFNAQRVLVIVPASLRIQWGERIKEWTTLPNVKVSVMLKPQDGIHPRANYQIISYNAATNPAIMRAIARYKWDVLILDESHNLKSIEAIRTRAILGNGKGMFKHGEEEMPAIARHCKRKLLLTGTPLLNRPSEAYTTLRFLDHEAIDYMGWEAFKDRYNQQAQMKTHNGKRFKLESTSLERELQNRLRANIMTRHEKHDVLKQLKPPRYGLVRVEENGAVKGALDVEGLLGMDIEDIQTTKDIEVLGHIAEARRLMGEAIAPQAAEYTKDFLEGSDEKIVLFGWHISVLNILEEKLSKYGLVRVDGRKNAVQRQKAVDDFINDPNIRVFLGNIQTAGTGVDGLQTVCSTCYIIEPDWVPAQNEQAVSRLDRIGQKGIVTAEIFVAPGSISEKILVRALEKLNVIFTTLDERDKNANSTQ